MSPLTGGQIPAVPARESRRRWLGLVPILVLVGVALAGIGGLTYAFARNDLRKLAEVELSHVADLKVAEVTRYRAELIADGFELAHNPTFVDLTRRALQDPHETLATRDLEAWLSNLTATHGYEVARVLDVDGTTFLATPA